MRSCPDVAMAVGPLAGIERRFLAELDLEPSASSFATKAVGILATTPSVIGIEPFRPETHQQPLVARARINP
jgi:hypothetical protein